jgi:LmbE family N-acetylglucosaminyl deacetylase
MTLTQTNRRLLGGLLSLFLVAEMVVSAAPAQSAGEIDPLIEGTVLVVAPHPDDDVITAAGIAYNRPGTTIAYMTHGDSHTVVVSGTATGGTGGTTLVDAGKDFADEGVETGMTIAVVGKGTATIASVAGDTLGLTGLSGGLVVGDEYSITFIPDGIAETRQQEAIDGQAFLGQGEDDLIFLGYPDFKLCRVWDQFYDDDPRCQNYGAAPVTGGTEKQETYGSRGLGRTDWHNYRVTVLGQPGAPHGSYVKADLLADVVALIEYVRPDHVFTTNENDGTLDHAFTHTIVRAAMEQAHQNDPSYTALLHSTIVWQSPFEPQLNAAWPADYTGGAPKPHTDPPDAAQRAIWGIPGDFTPTWDDRQTFNVPSALLNPNTALNPKYQAIDAHQSQEGMTFGNYIAKFFHSDEFFWVEAIPTPTAKDDGPYEVAKGGTLNVNGVLDNDIGVQLSASVKTQPTNGTVSLKADGSFSYAHNGTATASDSFTYRAQDPAGTFDDATVSITVTLDGPPTPPPPSGHTVGLVDPATGKWHLYDNTGKLTRSFFFGNPGDFPIMGDWDCNGVETPGMYRQSDGFVYLRNSNSQGVADIKFFFGDPGDVPLAGDFNGNGCDTVSIYRPAQSKVFIINELGENNGGLGEAEFSYFFGNPGDKPFVGDFNGNGIETLGLHRETTGLVYFRLTHTQGPADTQFIFGDPGDRLVAGDWNGNGAYSPALFRPSNTTTYFRYTNTQGVADATWTNGQSPWLPVAGNI